MSSSDPTQPIRLGVDFVAASTLFAAIADWLPKVLGMLGAVFSILWFIVQLWESKTIQNSLSAWRTRRKSRRLLKLRAKAKILAAKIAAVETVRVAKVVATELVAQARNDAAIKLVADDVKVDDAGV